MKAIEINGEIKIFDSLPKSWNDGERIHENIKDYDALGFKDLVFPEYDSRIQNIENLHLEDNVYTYDVVDITVAESLSELKSDKIKELKSMIGIELSKTDWYIIREADNGEATPQAIKDDRAALRSKGDELEDQINALTTKKAVVLFDINL